MRLWHVPLGKRGLHLILMGTGIIVFAAAMVWRDLRGQDGVQWLQHGFLVLLGAFAIGAGTMWVRVVRRALREGRVDSAGVVTLDETTPSVGLFFAGAKRRRDEPPAD
jgi:hypothetical protein